MNLFENLYLFKEMSRKRKEVLNKLDDKNEVRYEHLIKLYFYRDTRRNDFISWCEEVANFSKRHSSYSQIKLKDFIKILWTQPKDDYDKDTMNLILKDFYRKGYPEINNYNYENFYNYLKDFHMWLSELLVKQKIVLAYEVENKVTELLNKYPIE